MRRACGECRRVGLQCESYTTGGAPCTNCLERGCATLCLDGQAPSTPQSLTDTPQLSTAPTSFLSLILRLGTQLQGHLRHQLHNLLRIFQYVYIPILLFWPVYYADQASNVLRLANEIKSGEGSAGVTGTPVAASPTAGQPVYPSDNIELQAIAYDPNATFTTTQSTDTIPTPPPYSSMTQLPLPDSIKDLEGAWINYLDSRIIEWRISTTTACVFVAASPTIFQIPEASDDPITRSIAFLALCRALSGIIYGPIFLIYFKRNQARTASYANAWCTNAQEPGILIQWSPWIMLSLPTVSTCWAFIFYLVAIFSFIWRTGSIADPSPTSPNNPGYHPMAIPLALAVRIAITAITVMDLGCVVWIWKTLRRHNIASNLHAEAT